MPKSEMDAFMGEYFAFTDGIKKSGHYVGATDEGVEDDRLRLVFTCCHPALPPDAQIALTLREVCGLTTEEIAHAFLTAPRTVAQRIVRAKGEIRDARIPTRCRHATISRSDWIRCCASSCPSPRSWDCSR